jgi:ATPase subunit of ABC transporter with duplicated ATPase domains
VSLSNPSVVLHDVSFRWPDGAVALERISGTFGRGRTGLTGANGAGKSTLLNLVAGHLALTSGAISASGTVDYLPQRIAAHPDAVVGDLLGVATVLRALRAIEAGSSDPDHYDAVGPDWDVEERAAALLATVGLSIGLDRPVATLSGGEAMLVAITGIRLRGADIALLDEPTNNLDAGTRERLYEVVRGWRGALIVVSHDLTLLDLMDDTAELRTGSLTTFGGPYSEYRSYVDTQQQAARQALRTAKQTLRREQRERIEAEERIAHSERQGRKDRLNRTFVPAAINARRNSAEKSAGARRGMLDAKVEAAREAVAQAEFAIRDDDRIRVDLPDPKVPAGRRLAEIVGRDGRGHVIQGPERVALTGSNGAGKTMLIEALLPRLTVHVGYLPQRIVLDDDATVLDLVGGLAPTVPAGELRNRLARLLIRGAMVERRVGTLSGGERFRVALARVLLADPTPQLLILDEPTNDLDIDSVEQLVDALTAYRGGLLVVSHDRAFLDRLGIDVELRLAPDGNLSWC